MSLNKFFLIMLTGLSCVSARAADSAIPYDKLRALYLQNIGAAAEITDFELLEQDAKMNCVAVSDSEPNLVKEFPVPRRYQLDGEGKNGPLFPESRVTLLMTTSETADLSAEQRELEANRMVVRRNMYDLVVLNTPQPLGYGPLGAVLFRKVGRVVAFKTTSETLKNGYLWPVSIFGYCWR